ncbi:Nn.00g095530.m01.CDS01 [Neocucurbitaria sp. VM-36]
MSSIVLCADLKSTATSSYVTSRPTGGFGIIHSAPRSDNIPSTPTQSQPDTIDLIPSAPLPTSLIPSQPPQPTQIPPPVALIPSAVAPSGIIPSASKATSSLGLVPSAPLATDVTFVISPSLVASGTPVMQSTDQGLRPIPPAATQIGDPNGHHEITEPNFTATKPCRGCQPVIEITATGWLDSPAEEQHGTTETPAKATIPAGNSNIVISQDPTGGNFVIGDSTTLTPGQTITVDDTPIAIQTSEGRTEVVVGTTIIPLKPDETRPQITDAPVPLPPVLTIGSTTITPNAKTQYIIAEQTLAPGGPALTVSGTTFSLAPSATALIVNGETSTFTPTLGVVYTTEMPAALTFDSHIYTTNRAGYIVMGPGTTLIPGGNPVTVDGTTLSLEHAGTAIVVQGTTSVLQPVTTVVTLTRAPSGGGVGAGVAGPTTGSGLAYPTEKPVPGGAAPRYGYTVVDRWLAGLLMLIWWGFGCYFAIDS